MGTLEVVTSEEVLRAFRKAGQLRAFRQYSDGDIWKAVQLADGVTLSNYLPGEAFSRPRAIIWYLFFTYNFNTRLTTPLHIPTGPGNSAVKTRLRINASINVSRRQDHKFVATSDS